MFDHSGIASRRLAMPVEWYLEPHGFGERNQVFIEVALDLLAEAATRALERAGVTVETVDTVVCVTSTGIAVPTLDARLGDRIGLRPDVARVPLFGLGCGGGILGLARAAALARADAGSRVLLLVIELCSLALRRADASRANLVACALFGDGAAAAVVSTVGRGAAILATGEYRWPHSGEVMGWRVEDDGLGVLFSPHIPEFVRSHLGTAIADFLARHRLGRDAIDAFAVHAGGPRVLAALDAVLQLPARDREIAAATLRDYGNISAVSVLLALKQRLRSPWERLLALAMGPGFTAGFALLAA
ncbi:1,3,6,8-tetrahydroxynaphthalene synthase [bacterium HR40]|nr:1,3,6,8-tetrahydroxynaphthalene synthase [bacterium HR40]